MFVFRKVLINAFIVLKEGSSVRLTDRALTIHIENILSVDRSEIIKNLSNYKAWLQENLEEIQNRGEIKIFQEVAVHRV